MQENRPVNVNRLNRTVSKICTGIKYSVTEVYLGFDSGYFWVCKEKFFGIAVATAENFNAVRHGNSPIKI